MRTKRITLILLLIHVMSTMIPLCISYSAEPDFTMNGYRYDDFKDFEKKWHFVTVRYRGDTKEMRFTYANDIAYKALLSGSNDYPNGARFGKVSIQTHQDISFISSRVPAGKVRHTFMVRDKNRHKDTYGWGYALFDPSGKPFSGDHKTESMACATCHQIVKETGHVFSKLMGQQLHVDTTVDWKSKLTFTKTSIAKLPKLLFQKLPPNIKSIQLIEGPLRNNLFFGTLDEIRPVLFEQVKNTGEASGLISHDGKAFSVAYPLSLPQCVDHKGAKAFHTLPNRNKEYYEIEVCLSDI